MPSVQLTKDNLRQGVAQLLWYWAGIFHCDCPGAIAAFRNLFASPTCGQKLNNQARLAVIKNELALLGELLADAPE
ncbi:MAG: hypothetical protein F6K00_18705 [Leptolyngbya sp. SIOISBB]|nr:hypothetical protein [Leptolyngbya sp. SIOISBB]